MRGLLLDTSILIGAERSGNDFWDALLKVRRQTGAEEIGVSSLTLMELAYGITRADTESRRDFRQRFLSDVSRLLDVYPVTEAVATVAGTVEGELSLAGIRVATVDLLIGVTARELGFGVATHNLRHFGRIPGLQLISV
jgi:tRNA(fMet)-specific endonuclease VapC